MRHTAYATESGQYCENDGPDAKDIIGHCQQFNLYLRNASVTDPSLSPKGFRIAAKDAETNRKMVDIIKRTVNYFNRRSL